MHHLFSLEGEINENVSDIMSRQQSDFLIQERGTCRVFFLLSNTHLKGNSGLFYSDNKTPPKC